VRLVAHEGMLGGVKEKEEREETTALGTRYRYF